MHQNVFVAGEINHREERIGREGSENGTKERKGMEVKRWDGRKNSRNEFLVTILS